MNVIFQMPFVCLGIGEWISNAVDGVVKAIQLFFFQIFYAIGAALCAIVEMLDKLFSTMSGTSYVTYDGSKDFLINVFFHNSTINNIYWGIALIGIALCFAFTIIAVARKSVDMGDKIRQSMGGILTGLFKSILLIISMSAIMTVVLYSSNILLTQVDYTFRNADALGRTDSIEYTNEQYAAMARALDTIGNYSLNPSYDSRYNINSCFNEIRDDLYFLEQTGVFDFEYDTEEDGESWQSVLQDIAKSADLTEDLKADVYNSGVTAAITNAVEQLQTNAYFYPLQNYTQAYQIVDSEYMTLDRVIFLSCTFEAANNPSYNENASLSDSLRAPYYYGDKSIYDLEAVGADFDITEISYLLMYVLCLYIGWDLLVIIMNCIARIFNMLLLYLISPLIISTIPLDDGGKMKQWTTAFVVQSFGVFGTVISMRVLITLTPIIMSSKLVLFENNSFLNCIGKVLLVIGSAEVAKRASGMITGILADNAGYQSVMAGDMSSSIKEYAGGARDLRRWVRDKNERAQQKREHRQDREQAAADRAQAQLDRARNLAKEQGTLPTRQPGASSRDSDGSSGGGSIGGGSASGSLPGKAPGGGRKPVSPAEKEKGMQTLFGMSSQQIQQRQQQLRQERQYQAASDAIGDGAPEGGRGRSGSLPGNAGGSALGEASAERGRSGSVGGHIQPAQSNEAAYQAASDAIGSGAPEEGGRGRSGSLPGNSGGAGLDDAAAERGRSNSISNHAAPVRENRLPPPGRDQQ